LQGCSALAGRLAQRVNLLKLRVINLGSENSVNRVQISAVAACRELHAVRQTFLQIGEKVIRASGMTLADEPAWNKSRFRCAIAARTITWMFSNDSSILGR